MTAGKCLLIFKMIKTFVCTLLCETHSNAFNTFFSPLCIHWSLLMREHFSLVFLLWNCCYFMVTCTTFAPATLAPFTMSSLPGKTSCIWVSVFTMHLPVAPWLASLPVRGQTRQTIPVAAWGSTDLRDFGCQEVAEGALAAGTGTTWCVWRTFRSDKDSWWGCQSHKNNWIAPAQQSLQQEFQLYRRTDRFRKTFQINRRLLKRCLKFVLGCFGFFFPVKKKICVCVCVRGHMWFLPDPPPPQGYLSCQYCSERTLLTSKTGSSRKVRNKN